MFVLRICLVTLKPLLYAGSGMKRELSLKSLFLFFCLLALVWLQRDLVRSEEPGVKVRGLVWWGVLDSRLGQGEGRVKLKEQP